jgi:hypothetical protein
MVHKSLALAIALLLCADSHVVAQEAASVVGMVTDESKSVVPGVTVTATEVSSGRQHVAVTDNDSRRLRSFAWNENRGVGAG